MGHLRVVLGFGVYCLLLWVAPMLVIIGSGLFLGAWLLFIVYAALTDSAGSSKTGNWKSNDIDARD